MKEIVKVILMVMAVFVLVGIICSFTVTAGDQSENTLYCQSINNILRTSEKLSGVVKKINTLSKISRAEKSLLNLVCII